MGDFSTIGKGTSYTCSFENFVEKFFNSYKSHAWMILALSMGDFPTIEKRNFIHMQLSMEVLFGVLKPYIYQASI